MKGVVLKLGRCAFILLGFALVTVLALAICLYVNMLRSRPQLDGELRTAQVKHELKIQRDENGVPTIEATNLGDAVYAMGFLHAQERYFQMDLLRRKASGELAELFGARLIESDKVARVHRFRARAKEFVDELAPDQRAMLRKYTAGVNEGLQRLGAAPFEYSLLFSSPRLWSEEDTLLVNMAMYITLQGEEQHPELIRQKLIRRYDIKFADFILAPHSEWDSPIEAEKQMAETPLPKQLNRRLTVALHAPRVGDRAMTTTGGEEHPIGTVLGSNSWAVSGRKGAGGRALIANDMHLPLQQPNTFYRLAIRIAGRDGVIAGVSVPGLPMLAAGSNGRIAWGLTNANGDWSDLVRIDKKQAAAQVRSVRETIAVRGGDPVELDVRETRWGPIVSEDESSVYAMEWVAHHAEGNNLGLFPLLEESTLDGARDIAANAGMPHMNIVLADRQGNIAWTVAGRIPRRVGVTGLKPQEWNDQTGWQGWLSVQEYPFISGAEHDYLWTANNRVVGGEDWKKIGIGSQFALGVRAKRIHERLLASRDLREQDMHAMQLDDVALLARRWHRFASDVVAGMKDSREKTELASVLSSWDGTAGADQAAYRVLQRYRGEIAEDLMRAVLADLVKKEPGLDWYSVTSNWEIPLWKIVSSRPQALTPLGYENWGDYFRQVLLHDVYEPYSELYAGDLSRAKWGEANILEIRHPLSRIIPLIGNLLDMPATPMSGDSNTILAVRNSFGPAMRLVVSPGRENEAILTMPAGQAGNPLTPYYRKGHQQWLRGEPQPLLPGKSVHSLQFKPRKSD